VAALLLAFAATRAPAQEWARKMFDGTSHSFGTVARGAKVEHPFKFKNIYKEDIHVASVRSSCGCTTPVITKQTLKTYEESQVVAQFNTRSFLGEKSATITVVIDRPYYAEVQLHVSGYIRSDVVVEPGMIDLGSVDQGTAAERRVQVTYAGRDTWQIRDVLSANEHLEAELHETARGNGQVSYSLLVRLKADAPVGYLKDQVTLVTNDSRASQIPIDVEGRVLSELTVSPSSLFMGVMQPGQKRTKQLVIKGKKPFKITAIDCDDEGFSFDLPETAKQSHLVTVTYVAGDEPGKVSQKIRIETDLEGNTPPEVSAYAEVVKGSE
jgi:hypothetical protein